MITFLIIYFTGAFFSFLVILLAYNGSDKEKYDKQMFWLSFTSYLVILSVIYFYITDKEVRERFNENFAELKEIIIKFIKTISLSKIINWITVHTGYHINLRYILTPLATIIINPKSENNSLHWYKMIYIFGIRIARFHIIN